MKEVIRIFEEIKNTSSTNSKKEIISRHKDNELFKKCLSFLLNSNVITGISVKKITKQIVSPNPNYKLTAMSVGKQFSDIVGYLAEHNTGTDEDVYVIQEFLSWNEDNREFYEQMITKKYRLGCDAKLVNQCIPNLIPTFDVQLGTSIDHVKMKGDELIFISRKLNGTRSEFTSDKIMTRQGKTYIGLDHIIKDLQSIVGTETFVDGELLYKNKEGLSDSEAFQKGTGIAMSKNPDKSDLKLVIFDMIPLAEFWAGKSKEPYSVRKQNLLALKEKIAEFGTENLEIVEMCYEGYDHTEIWKWLDYAENNDWEGVIVNLDAPYECKRTKNLIKVKQFFTCDLRVIGVEEGTGRNKGVLGALVVEYKNNTVNVGSGFTDDQRRFFWENQEDIIGRVVEVKYKEVTIDKKTGLESLQFPVLVSVREDGKEPSYE